MKMGTIAESDQRYNPEPMQGRQEREAYSAASQAMLGPDGSGSTEKNSVRARVFRFALELGHSTMQSSPRTSK